MIKENMFYIVNEIGYKFEINPRLKILPILWCQNGTYRVFSKEILANAIDTLGLQDAHYSEKPAIRVVNIWWGQGLEIDNLAGRALSGE